MSLLENILCTSTDIVLLLDILIFTSIIQQNFTKKSFAHLSAYFFAYTVISVLFYCFYFNTKTPVLMFCFIFVYYIRFPVVIAKTTNVSFLKGIYSFFLITQCCDLLQTLVWNIIKIPNRILEYSIAFVIRALLLIILMALRNKTDLNKLKVTLNMIPKSIYILLAVNILLMGAIASVTTYNTANLSAQVVSINVVLLLIFAISTIITLSLVSNCISKTYYNNINSLLEKQIKNQIEHYKRTESLNNDLRRFRHDYTNHMLCLKSMISANQLDDATEYIEQINRETAPTAKLFNTGHKIADAILNENSRAHKNIRISFDGHIPDFLDNVDLCIILGNAIDNAVEACEKLSAENSTIAITAKLQQNHFILIITNTAAPDLIIKDAFPETTKDNPMKHGIGLSNIKRIVDKYEGDMSVNAENGTFTLYLAFKTDK